MAWLMRLVCLCKQCGLLDDAAIIIWMMQSRLCGCVHVQYVCKLVYFSLSLYTNVCELVY